MTYVLTTTKVQASNQKGGTADRPSSHAHNKGGRNASERDITADKKVLGERDLIVSFHPWDSGLRDSRA